MCRFQLPEKVLQTVKIFCLKVIVKSNMKVKTTPKLSLVAAKHLTFFRGVKSKKKMRTSRLIFRLNEGVKPYFAH